MLLKNDHVGELLAADWTRVDCADIRLGAVYAHVRLQVALGGEGAPTQAAAEWALTGVGSIVHEQCTAAAQRSKADRALVGVEVAR